jgi:hypothetical protein
VLWISIGFNADLDPGFYLNAVPDPGSQTNADPVSDPGQAKKLNFYIENILELANRSKSISVKVQKPFICWSIPCC